MVEIAEKLQGNISFMRIFMSCRDTSMNRWRERESDICSKEMAIKEGTVCEMVGHSPMNRTHYPGLLKESVSAKEVIEKLKRTDEKLVKIASKDDYIWYITKSENNSR